VPSATAGSDFKATDWAAISAADTGDSTEYTPVSPLTGVECDEQWILDAPAG
jgi:hypothetical protein